MTRNSNCVAALATGIFLFLAGSAWAAPVHDLPDLPIDQIAPPVTESTTTGPTPVIPAPPVTDGNVPPTTGAPPTQDSPEPATLTLLGLGGFGAWWHVRRRKAAARAVSDA